MGPLSENEIEGLKEHLLGFANEFRAAAKQYEEWSSGDRDEPKDQTRTDRSLLSGLALRVGKCVFPLAEQGHLRLPPMPDKVRAEPVALDEGYHRWKYYDLWWLAFVGWLETDRIGGLASPSTPSYATNVFQAWMPGVSPWGPNSELDEIMLDGGQWLGFESDLLKEHSQSACLQSADAIEFVVERLGSSDGSDRRHPRDEPGDSPSCRESPTIVLGKPTDPVLVGGIDKGKVTTAQFAVLKALLNAGESGLTKDRLKEKSGHEDAVNILKRLARKDEDWASIISLAGKTGGGYHLKL